MSKVSWSIDLTGQRIGRWSVIKRSAEKKYHWTCQCECGSIKDVHYNSLQNGSSKGCTKCAINETLEKNENEKIGKKFGLWTVIKRSEKKDGNYFTCQCECGSIKDIDYTSLQSGKSSSCGCLKAKENKKYKDKLISYIPDNLSKYQKDGTMLYVLKQKISKSNKSGVKGVIKRPNGRYTAYINLRRKQHYLGTYATLEEAKLAREKAEEEMYKPILDKYK